MEMDKEYLTMLVITIGSVILFGCVSIALAFRLQQVGSKLQQALEREKAAAIPIYCDGCRGKLQPKQLSTTQLPEEK